MRSDGSADETWEDDDASPNDDACRAALYAAKSWLARVQFRRLDYHMRAAAQLVAEREMAFDAMAIELVAAIGHAQAVVDLATRLRAENKVLRRALARRRGDASRRASPDTTPDAAHGGG